MGVCMGTRSASSMGNKADFFAVPKSREELYRFRREFWETRTTGSRQTWLELKRAQEVASDGDPDTAKTLMAALECSPWKEDPSKTFRYTFDSLGRRYDVPMYIFKDPDNLIDDVEEDDSFNDTDILTFRVRPSNASGDISFEKMGATKVAEIKRETLEHLGLDPLKHDIRMVYQGKILQSQHSLMKPVRIQNDMVVQAFIYNSNDPKVTE